MESINFATYFRPQTYADVVGQDIPKSVLKKVALAPGISVRSIFLKGAWGSGKSTLSRIFSKSMNCSKFKETGDVCNECDSCKEVSSPNSQLYWEFDSASVGNIDFIRSLPDKLSIVPNGRRVVCFDECHAASKAAQNALLKLVEEGVPNTIFLFCSTDDVISTIKSRSLCIEITTIPHELIIKRLREVASIRHLEIDDNALSFIATKSMGHMRDALSYLQLYEFAGKESLNSSYQYVVKFFSKCLSKKSDEAKQILDSILLYNVVDVKNSIYLFIKNVYVSQPSSPLYKLLQTGVINKVFSFFFSPVAQSALKDEVGINILLRSFIEKICNG